MAPPSPSRGDRIALTKVKDTEVEDTGMIDRSGIQDGIALRYARNYGFPVYFGQLSLYDLEISAPRHHRLAGPFHLYWLPVWPHFRYGIYGAVKKRQNLSDRYCGGAHGRLS